MPSGRWWEIWFGIILSVAVTLLVISKFSPGPLARRPAPVAAGKEASTRPQEPRFLGVLLPYDAVDVSAKRDGCVDLILVEVGQRVRKGDMLASLDTAEVTEADLAIASAQLHQAQADERRLSVALEQARERFERMLALGRQGLVPDDQIAELRYQEQLVSAELARAHGRVSEMQALVRQRTMLVARTKVVAPFDGVIATRYVQRGANVGTGTPIVRLVSTDALRFRFAVPAEQAVFVHRGLPVEVSIDESDVTLHGAIRNVAPEVDAASQMLVVEAILHSRELSTSSLLPILAGRTGRVAVTGATGPALPAKTPRPSWSLHDGL